MADEENKIDETYPTGLSAEERVDFVLNSGK